MSIAGITNNTTPALSQAASQNNLQKTVEQRAQEGDPTATAEVKQQQEQQSPGTGPSEPGKGENVDQYI
jgi:hypothetical protein